MFLQASVILLTGGEACVVGGGGVCGLGGVCGFFRGCMVFWEVYVVFLGGGVCMVFLGVHGFVGGHSFFGGLCMLFFWGMHGPLEGVCIEYNEIWSMSGRYASYWNAFLLHITFQM